MLNVSTHHENLAPSSLSCILSKNICNIIISCFECIYTVDFPRHRSRSAWEMKIISKLFALLLTLAQFSIKTKVGAPLLSTTIRENEASCMLPLNKLTWALMETLSMFARMKRKGNVFKLKRFVKIIMAKSGINFSVRLKNFPPT